MCPKWKMDPPREPNFSKLSKFWATLIYNLELAQGSTLILVQLGLKVKDFSAIWVYSLSMVRVKYVAHSGQY